MSNVSPKTKDLDHQSPDITAWKIWWNWRSGPNITQNFKLQTSSQARYIWARRTRWRWRSDAGCSPTDNFPGATSPMRPLPPRTLHHQQGGWQKCPLPIEIKNWRYFVFNHWFQYPFTNWKFFRHPIHLLSWLSTVTTFSKGRPYLYIVYVQISA